MYVVPENITCVIHLQKTGKEHSGRSWSYLHQKLSSLGLKTTRAEKTTRVETHVSIHPGMRTVDKCLFHLVENMSKCYFT